MTLGDIISEYTKAHSMNQFIQDSGLSRTYVYMLIRNQNNNGSPITPSIDTIRKVSAGIHSSFDKVFDRLDDDLVIHLGNYSTIPDDLMRIYRMLPIDAKENVHKTIMEEYKKNEDIIKEYQRIKKMDKITDVNDAQFLVDYSVSFGDSDKDDIIIETANRIKRNPKMN
jgi:hypothetical protein